MRHWFYCKKIIFLIFAVLAITTAHAGEYGHYDLMKIVATSGTPPNVQRTLDLQYLDRVINDLAAHAKSYPPRFDTPEDKARATDDTKRLAGMLEVLTKDATANPDVLLRSAFLGSMGNNLGLAGHGQKANANFQRYLSLRPSDPRGNYLYGMFLAGTGQLSNALPYLEKAKGAGVADAWYAMGMVYVGMGKKELAIENLTDYKRLRPDNKEVDQLIDAVQSGKVDVRKN